MKPTAESRSCRSQARCVGVSPEGAHVRRRTGWSMKPLSSKKTIGLPLRWAPFLSAANPASAIAPWLVVGFAGPLLGLLARPAQVVEHLPNVIGVILHVELLGHNLGHPPTRPKIGVVSGLPRSGQENLDQLLLLLRIQTGLAAGMWFGFQRLQASFLHSPTPPSYRRC